RARPRRARAPARRTRHAARRRAPCRERRRGRRLHRLYLACRRRLGLATRCRRGRRRRARGRSYSPGDMGDEQRVGWQDLLAESREAFDSGTDFTLAVEEEFALLDPQTLGLTNRFEEIYAAAVETDLAPNIVGELIASEVEVRTGRCTNFTEAAAAMQERR